MVACFEMRWFMGNSPRLQSACCGNTHGTLSGRFFCPAFFVTLQASSIYLQLSLMSCPCLACFPGLWRRIHNRMKHRRKIPCLFEKERIAVEICPEKGGSGGCEIRRPMRGVSKSFRIPCFLAQEGHGIHTCFYEVDGLRSSCLCNTCRIAAWAAEFPSRCGEETAYNPLPEASSTETTIAQYMVFVKIIFIYIESYRAIYG